MVGMIKYLTVEICHDNRNIYINNIYIYMEIASQILKFYFIIDILVNQAPFNILWTTPEIHSALSAKLYCVEVTQTPFNFSRSGHVCLCNDMYKIIGIVSMFVQVSLQQYVGCGDTCQIWMCNSTGEQCFDWIEAPRKNYGRDAFKPLIYDAPNPKT